MKKENKLKTEEMIELESWLKENENNSLTVSKWIELFAKLPEQKRNYIMMAKLLPREDLEVAIEYIDCHRFPVIIDELGYVNNLARKYTVDKMMIIERIKQVRMIKNHQKNEIKTKKRKK